MDDVQENHMGRAQKVLQFLILYVASLGATPDLTGILKTSLQNAIQKASDDDAVATANTTGNATAKAAKRSLLELLLDHIAAAIVSYADDIDDFVLMNMLQFNFAAIQGMRDDRFLQLCEFVLAKANDATIKAAIIASHNVTAQQVTDFAAHTADYRILLPAPTFARSEKKALGKLVDRDFAGIEEILSRIRIKMRVYRQTNQTMYEVFLAADSIDDTGSHAPDVFEGSVGISSSKEVGELSYRSDAQIKIENTGFVALIFTLFLAGSPTGTDATVAAGATLTITMGSLATNGDSLHVKNNDASMTGNYKVTI